MIEFLLLCMGVGFLVVGFWRVAVLSREIRTAEKADHAKCIAHIASVVSHQTVAQALRTAADDWDSIENQADLQRLAREKYTPGGPSMPVIWLRERADRLDKVEAH